MIENHSNSNRLYEKAQHLIPGGVNSPVRAFKGVGGTPVFIRSANGAFLYDEDGNRYIDLINSWGPMILGHAFPKAVEAVQRAILGSSSFGAPTSAEVEMAELICSMIPSVEMVRMVNSGTEATMSAVRVARGYTKRDKIIKMEGCYHGHGDSFLIAAGSGALTMGTPDSPGVTKGTAGDTLLASFNNLESVEQLLKANKDQVAAVIVEPVVGNMGCVPPAKGYLNGLRALCDQHNTLLIFDEVMTGFRLAPGGAQEVYGVTPDMTTLGKIIGGGLPVGAYGGRKEIMQVVSPSGPVYQAGTLSGNPIAMAAGIAMLNYLRDNPGVYVQLEGTGHVIAEGLQERASKAGIPCLVNRVGSMFTLFFTDHPVTDYASAKACDTKMFGRFFHAMLAQGVYMAPSQFEAMFISTAVDRQVTGQVLKAADEALKTL